MNLKLPIKLPLKILDQPTGLELEIICLRLLMKRIAMKAKKEKDPIKMSTFLDLLTRSTVRLGRCLELQSKLSGGGPGSQPDFDKMVHNAIEEVNVEMQARIDAGLPLWEGVDLTTKTPYPPPPCKP
jgi:hypothetical protein